MRNVAFVSALACTSLLSGCAQQLEQMKQVNQALVSINNPQPSNGRTMMGALQQTPAQSAAIESNLKMPVADANVAEARREASANISKLLQVLSCTPQGSDPYPYLESMKAPGTVPSVNMRPTSGMQYHPKGQCLTVTRLDGWRMQARNALQFRAIFNSDASGESKAIGYTFIKQPDGAWLLGNPANY